ncbi:hypothetical protein [Phreatobacter oligotrophus]|uniref:hypothetical protein n=1 Tax=Phreatobacter oligotrophus TaxID=1122261 RepID=UPI0023556E86|nr:hypothetical protein [Phreatobacter oligotrophus]MBX9990923.1 hypothetical protein [Phreatobacter oligotrophus]
MPNETVPAAATGLPNSPTSRRFFLGASIAAALVPSPGKAEAAECPRIVSLAGQRSEARRAVAAAQDAFAEARARCLAIWPETPAELRYMPGCPYERMGVMEEEIDFDGNRVWLADYLAKGIRWKGYRVPSVEGLKAYLDKFPRDASRKTLQRLLARTEDLQRRRRQAEISSGYQAADAALWAARAELDRVTRALAEAQPRTMAGVLAKAEAMAEAASLCTEQAYMTRQLLGPAIADDLVRLLRSVPAESGA